MKDKKKLFIIIISAIVVLITAISIFMFFSDENKLTKTEKEWIANNLSTVQSINIINNANVFGDNGSGVFYDFLKDFQTEYRLEINPVTFLQGEAVEGISFNSGNKVSKNDTIFYEDHYVVIGKEDKIVRSATNFNDVRIGVLNTDYDYLLKYFANYSFATYDTVDKLYEALKNGEIVYVMAPVLRDINKVLSENYLMLYHFSDVKYYYFFDGKENDNLSSIIRKYFNNWKEKYYKDIFYSNEFDTFVNALSLSDADVSELRSVSYKYGFVNQNPYEVITGGNFGGIVAVYLKNFSDFADIEFNFKKYSNLEKFEKAVNKLDVDLYFDYYEIGDKLESIGSSVGINAELIAPVKSKLTVSALSALDETVYVQKDSKIAKYLSENTKLKLDYFNSQKQMLKLAKKNKIIVLDSEIYNYYHKNKLKNYESRYHFEIDNSYSFRVKDKKGLKTLLKAYIRTLDPSLIKYQGIENHQTTVQKGNFLFKLAEYILIIAALAFGFIVIFYKRGKRLKIAKKIKNEDKVKYIDLLTSLKNRNYLTENMEVWNNNKIYPQTMIVIDLNNIAYLNDTKGYEAGDHQITALANILIKTQLDNSDVMRTNGNEFLIYLVGYQQKHVVNYIHKLNKELKKLPYEYGAAIGYSMIEDDIKTIEDAINEAIEDMKKQKAKSKEVKS